MAQMVNLWGSVLALAGSASFVVVYTLLAPWWRSRVGRLLLFKAATIAALMLITLGMYLLRVDSDILRYVRGILVGAFGVMMIYQAWLVVHSQAKGRNPHGAADDT